MNLISKENVYRWYRIAWWLCVITLPWIDMANNVSLILLTLTWAAEGNILTKWDRLKSSKWVWPFLFYYAWLLIGVVYTHDVDNGLFTLDKKISFLVLPILMSSGPPLELKFAAFLKRSFVYSCCAVVLLCCSVGTYYFLNGGTSANFDLDTNENFNAIHPDASPVWMHFSYIQLAHWAGIHPAYLSMYLVFCLVILATQDDEVKTNRNIHLLLGLLIACCIALLSSRMAIIAFAVSAGYLVFKKIQKRKVTHILPIVSGSAFLVFLLWLNPVTRFRVIEEPLITTYQADRSVTNWNSVSFRLLEWKGSWSVIRSNWIAGVGTGGGKLAMENFYKHYNNSTIGLEHNAHNQYLQTWMESGLTGLFVFLSCVFMGVFRLYKDASYVSFILIFSLMCLTESIGERQKGIMFFTLFQTLFLGIQKKSE